MQRARRLVVAAYAVALAVALAVGHRVPTDHPLAIAWWADVAGTLAIFAFSLVFRNSSFYDPYWSVAPIPIAFYWALRPLEVGVNPIRAAVVLALIVLWGARLTWNWTRGWQGLGHQDWRYADLQRRTGAFYPLVNLVGIHLAPTVWVFLGLLPVYVCMTRGLEPFGYTDLLAFAVTFGAIWLEARADKQLRRYRQSNPPAGEFLHSGLWAWSRHPNYLGEMGFWWGLWLFGVAAVPGAWWWTLVGPVSITLMFRFVSLPMIETRMQERRPGYAAWAERSSLVLPRPRRA